MLSKWDTYKAQADKALQQGMTEHAEALWYAALGEAESFEETDPRLTVTLETLAELLFRTRKYAQAEPICERTLAIYEHTLGDNHPDVGILANNLAMLFHVQEKFDRAEELYKKAMLIQTKTLGPKHPEVINLLGNYANLLHRTHRQAEAEHLRACANSAVTGKWNHSGRYQVFQRTALNHSDQTAQSPPQPRAQQSQSIPPSTRSQPVQPPPNSVPTPPPRATSVPPPLPHPMAESGTWPPLAQDAETVDQHSQPANRPQANGFAQSQMRNDMRMQSGVFPKPPMDDERMQSGVFSQPPVPDDMRLKPAVFSKPPMPDDMRLKPGVLPKPPLSKEALQNLVTNSKSVVPPDEEFDIGEEPDEDENNHQSGMARLMRQRKQQ